MRKRVIALYCLLVYAIAWSLQFAAIRATGGDLEADGAMPWLIGTMFVPGLTALLFVILHRPARAGLLWKPTWPTIPMALIGVITPALTAFAVLGVVEAMGWGKSGWFVFAADGATISGGPWLLGLGQMGWAMFAANVFVTSLAYALISALAAMGEEFGWRAFLQGHLIDRFGLTGGVIVLGLVWSFFHLPALLSGYNYPETPVLGAFVIFPIELVAVSFFFAWLTLSARSFWPAAIAHGSANAVQEGVIGNLQMTTPRLYEDLTTMGVTVVVGLLCWWWLSRRRARAGAGRFTTAAATP